MNFSNKSCDDFYNCDQTAAQSPLFPGIINTTPTTNSLTTTGIDPNLGTCTITLPDLASTTKTVLTYPYTITTPLEFDPSSKETVSDNEILEESGIKYNIKKDFKDNLIYDFAVPGYSKDRIEIKRVPGGVKVILEELKNDFLGEDFEYFTKNFEIDDYQSETILIDFSTYSDDIQSSLKNGILSIRFSPRKEKNIEVNDLND